jgi:hypothetical protein
MTRIARIEKGKRTAEEDEYTENENENEYMYECRWNR